MPKKKGGKKVISRDFTINDCANAPKPVTKLKKSVEATAPPDLSWDQIVDEEYDFIEEINEDGTKQFVYKKKRNNSKSNDNIDDQSSVVYPEIVWYLISKFIKPEDVGRFAGINKVTYAITKRESFWRLLYKYHCKNHPNLPVKLRLENSYKTYGLRQRVIRALYHTYDVFVKRITKQQFFGVTPHHLVKHCCINVWFGKGPQQWAVFFKFKKICPLQRLMTSAPVDFIEELGKVDANPEENCQVLQVTCNSFCEIPPLMGMTLSSLSLLLAQGFRHHQLHLGFNMGYHNVSKDILPECSVILDKIVSIVVLDWWHPKYPYFDNKLPSTMTDEEAEPVLKDSFFCSK
ncbi:hypothetical protein ACJJTC_005524 [Scirpophaga incertulas]